MKYGDQDKMRTEISMVTGRRVHQKDKKRAMDLKMLGLNEATCQLAMAKCVHWNGHVLRRVSKRKKDRQKST